MTEQIVQILERKDGASEWKVRTVIQLWPHIQEEMDRMYRFINKKPDGEIPPLSETEIAKLRKMIKQYDAECAEGERQAQIDEDLRGFPTEGDGY